MSGFLTGLVERGASLPAASDAPGIAAPAARNISADALEAPPEGIDAVTAAVPTPTDPGTRPRAPEPMRVEPAYMVSQVTELQPAPVVSEPPAPHFAPTGPPVLPAPKIVAEPAPADFVRPQAAAPAAVEIRQVVERRVTQVVALGPARTADETRAAPVVAPAGLPLAAEHAVSGAAQPSTAPQSAPAQIPVTKLPEVQLAPAPSASRDFPRAAQAATPVPAAPPPIHVRIGRVEVKPPAAAAVPAAPHSAGTSRAQGFAAYRRLRTYRA